MSNLSMSKPDFVNHNIPQLLVCPCWSMTAHIRGRKTYKLSFLNNLKLFLNSFKLFKLSIILLYLHWLERNFNGWYFYLI